MSPLAGILSPRARAIIYAVLALVVPLVTLAVALLADGWQWSDLPLMLTSAVSAAGFTMANNNTPTPDPEEIPGAYRIDRGQASIGGALFVVAVVLAVLFIVTQLGWL